MALSKKNMPPKSYQLKETRNSYFCVTPPKSGALRVCITFLQITQKVLTKAIFHWLELIPSFLQILSVTKTTTLLF